MPISLTLHTLHSSPLHWGEASPSPPLFAYCYRALVNGGLDLSVICMCVCGYAKLGIFPVTSVSRMSTVASTHTMDFFFFYWSLTILIFHSIATFLIFKQSVKWQWLEQECVNRTFAYRKLLYYNVHFHKLSVCESQNTVTPLQREETEK